MKNRYEIYSLISYIMLCTAIVYVATGYKKIFSLEDCNTERYSKQVVLMTAAKNSQNNE